MMSLNTGFSDAETLAAPEMLFNFSESCFPVAK
jgi:hypothetical protein